MKYSHVKNTMHDYNGYHHYNITNITNITHVHVTRPARTAFGNGSKHHGHNHHGGWKHRERPPKLARFCGSGGLLDRHVLANMSQGEMCDEAVKVIGYGARGFCRSAGKIGRSACGLAASAAGAASSLAQGFCAIGRKIFS